MSPALLAMTVAYGVLLIWEHLTPRKQLPHSRGWYARVAALVLCQFLISVAGANYLSELVATRTLTSNFKALMIALPCYFVVTFAMYWWHRLRHQSNFFWRTNHQLHHSPRRLEGLTTFYMHPIEIATNSTISVLTTCMLLGQPVQVHTWVAACTAIANFFFHTNIKTPRWLGYYIQRPEMHDLHHETGVHARNYSDLPIWDLLFGTFCNPQNADVSTGFSADQELKFTEMLSCKKVA